MCLRSRTEGENARPSINKLWDHIDETVSKDKILDKVLDDILEKEKVKEDV